MFSHHPFYFDFHSACVIFDVSSGFYFDGNEYKIRKWLVLKFHSSGHLQIILHLNKITECLKMTTFKIVFTFDVFFSEHMTPFYRQQKLPDNREYIKIQEWFLKQSYVQRNI
jgi:hypothetical protein